MVWQNCFMKEKLFADFSNVIEFYFVAAMTVYSLCEQLEGLPKILLQYAHDILVVLDFCGLMYILKRLVSDILASIFSFATIPFWSYLSLQYDQWRPIPIQINLCLCHAYPTCTHLCTQVEARLSLIYL
jgi:hypothetical protein